MNASWWYRTRFNLPHCYRSLLIVDFNRTFFMYINTFEIFFAKSGFLFIFWKWITDYFSGSVNGLSLNLTIYIPTFFVGNTSYSGSSIPWSYRCMIWFHFTLCNYLLIRFQYNISFSIILNYVCFYELLILI